jgi:hypothetical protein
MTITRHILLHPDAASGAGDAMPHMPHMPPLPPELAEQVELYLDGLLDASQREALEARMRTDEQLRKHVDELRAMDAAIGSSLRSTFAPQAVPLPATASLSLDQTAQPAATSRTLLQRIGWLRIAAAILLAGAAIFTLHMRQQYATPLLSPQKAYRNIVDAGFRPYVVCTGEQEFIDYTHRFLGVGLRVKPFDGLVLIGWNKDGDIFSEHTDSLLATVDGKQVIVFMDKQSNKRSLPKSASGLNIFQRDLAGITLVEVTPLSEPKLLNNFEQP